MDAQASTAIRTSPSDTAVAAWSLFTLAATALTPTLLVVPSLVAGRDLLDYHGGPLGMTWLVVVFLVPCLAGLAFLGALVARRARRAWPTVSGLTVAASLTALVFWAWCLTFVGDQVWPT